MNIKKKGCNACNKTVFEIVVLDKAKTNNDVVTANNKPIIAYGLIFLLSNLKQFLSIRGDIIAKKRNAVRNLKKFNEKGFISLLISFTEIPMKPQKKTC